VAELRLKSFPDLHRLWWVCLRERNRLATEAHSRSRIRPGYGALEAQERDRVVRSTMKAIKQALTERWYGWEDAYSLAQQDPEIEFALNADEGLTVRYQPFVGGAEGEDAFLAGLEEQGVDAAHAERLRKEKAVLGEAGLGEGLTMEQRERIMLEQEGFTGGDPRGSKSA